MVRFAPPVTDDLALARLQAAAVGYVLARRRGIDWVLRIDDTAPQPHAQSDDTPIKQLLEKCALQWDHLAYRSANLSRYQSLAAALVEQSKAYICTCGLSPHAPTDGANTPLQSADRCDGSCIRQDAQTLRRIREEHRPYVIRIHAPEAPVVFEDAIRGSVRFEPDAIDGFVLIRADGSATEDFACAVDDMLGGITAVVEADDHLLRFARQCHVRRQLGYTAPIDAAHLPPLETTAPFPATLRGALEEGFVPDAILNLLLHPGDEAPPLFTLPDAVTQLDLSDFARGHTHYTLADLRALNRAHIRRMEDKAVSRLYGFADSDIGRLVKLYLDHAATLPELDGYIRPFFAPKPCAGEHEASMRLLADAIARMPILREYDGLIDYLQEATGLEGEALTVPLRLLMTGSATGPALEAIYPLIQSYITEVARCPHSSSHSSS